MRTDEEETDDNDNGKVTFLFTGNFGVGVNEAPFSKFSSPWI
jgi:hypothetical protein